MNKGLFIGIYIYINRKDWSSIPSDILLLIFKELPAISISYCSFVCKKWFQIIQQEKLWEILYLRDFPYLTRNHNESSKQAYQDCWKVKLSMFYLISIFL